MYGNKNKTTASDVVTLIPFTCFTSIPRPPQNTDPSENFGNLRGGGRLHEEHMFGEVIANVMGNFKIYSAGVYFDRYQFENQDGSKRELFGPWAYKREGGFYVLDSAGLPSRYTDEDWFRTVKARWATNFQGLKTYKVRKTFHKRSFQRERK